MAFLYYKAVPIPIRIYKTDILGAAKQVPADIRADALQHSVGFFPYQKKKEGSLPAGKKRK